MLYLPHILDQTLRCFSHDFGLTSWKISGGKWNNATVILRFGSNSHNPQDEQSQIMYRRKPFSAQQRDRQRLQQHKSNMPNQPPLDNDMQNVDISNAAEFIPGATMHGCAPLLETPPLPALPQVDGICDSNSIKHGTFMDTTCRSPTEDVFTNKNELNESDIEATNVIALTQALDMNSVQDVQSDHSQLIDSNQISDKESIDSDSDDIDSVNDGLIKCRQCECILGQGITQWYKCTYCSNAESHYDVCVQCYDSKYHNEHGQSMMMFNEPANGNQMYCDSCGYEFKTNDRTYECTECKKEVNGDFLFEMCRQCYNKGFHSVHQCYLRRIRGKVS